MEGLRVDFLIMGSVVAFMGRKKNGPRYRDPFTLEIRYNNTTCQYEKDGHLYLSIEGLSSYIILRTGHDAH